MQLHEKCMIPKTVPESASIIWQNLREMCDFISNLCDQEIVWGLKNPQEGVCNCLTVVLIQKNIEYNNK